MLPKISQFYLTHHFNLRAKHRSIGTPLLYKILPFIKLSKEDKKLAIITPSFLSQFGLAPKENNCLVIVLIHTLLVTIFWCSDPDYLIKKEKQSDFQILY